MSAQTLRCAKLAVVFMKQKAIERNQNKALLSAEPVARASPDCRDEGEAVALQPFCELLASTGTELDQFVGLTALVFDRKTATKCLQLNLGLQGLVETS